MRKWVSDGFATTSVGREVRNETMGICVWIHQNILDYEDRTTANVSHLGWWKVVFVRDSTNSSKPLLWTPNTYWNNSHWNFVDEDNEKTTAAGAGLFYKSRLHTKCEESRLVEYLWASGTSGVLVLLVHVPSGFWLTGFVRRLYMQHMPTPDATN